ncbi:hypothetical protein [Alkalimonas amylolytica]|uniref:Cytochrome C n=1 Tax=Alkalimonas amylolytica TaxID=152573 RepID=A0A1H4CHI8_ALKAM|nr:hypothetical protein [Alkalimonas amylolytica]SEA59789.1 hypothetical protein SAMN04488051_104162 [Alkalimonas amylolytica]
MKAPMMTIALTLMMGFNLAQGSELPSSNHWLLEASSDEERFARIEKMFAGFSGAMAEVGARYQHSYDAIVDENYALASYHWDKLGAAIQLGYFRRPGRADNAKAIFLQTAWPQLTQALDEGDTTKIQRSFLHARSACMACHVAEQVPFMNDQPLFRQTAEFK